MFVQFDWQDTDHQAVFQLDLSFIPSGTPGSHFSASSTSMYRQPSPYKVDIVMEAKVAHNDLGHFQDLSHRTKGCQVGALIALCRVH